VREFEAKLSKEELKEFAKYDERYKLAKITHEISLLTEGMLVLDKVLMGVIEIDPKEILVDGIRKELGRTLAEMLHEGFIFDRTKQDMSGEMFRKFEALRDKIKGLKRSIEYIQDFLNIYGEKIWNEEIVRLIEFAVEKEATNLVNRKYQGGMIEAQESYNIPIFTPVDGDDFTFMGRVLRHILRTIEKGFYLDHLSSWYDSTGSQLFGLRHVNYVQDYLGTAFLVGLDRLITYNIVNRTNDFFSFYGLSIGGGGITQKKRDVGKVFNPEFVSGLRSFDEKLSVNLGNTNQVFLKDYKTLKT
jgi:WASH complex subunit strumpellin